MAGLGFMGRLKERLGKTRTALAESVKRVFTGRRVDDEVWEELEQVLVEADLGIDTTLAIIDDMKRVSRERGITESDELYTVLKEELITLLCKGDRSLTFNTDGKPHVTLIAGVNGSGKTTTTGKIAAKLTAEGRKVVLGAADTFRAAAGEQLAIWSERSGAQLVRHAEGADPASVAFDSVEAGIARGADNVLIDTAGRLHTKVNLMEEMKKVQRVVAKRLPGAPHEVLLVLDATTGQNGLQQARVFTEALTVTGIVLTKLDGTAKGGMAVAIQRELGIPIKLIGIGEGVDDLQPFEPREFIEALFRTEDSPPE